MSYFTRIRWCEGRFTERSVKRDLHGGTAQDWIESKMGYIIENIIGPCVLPTSSPSYTETTRAEQLPLSPGHFRRQERYIHQSSTLKQAAPETSRRGPECGPILAPGPQTGPAVFRHSYCFRPTPAWCFHCPPQATI